jgi:hypothetical protein
VGQSTTELSSAAPVAAAQDEVTRPENNAEVVAASAEVMEPAEAPWPSEMHWPAEVSQVVKAPEPTKLPEIAPSPAPLPVAEPVILAVSAPIPTPVVTPAAVSVAASAVVTTVPAITIAVAPVAASVAAPTPPPLSPQQLAAQAAVAWATAELHSADPSWSNEMGRAWSGYCEAFVEIAYGTRHHFGSASADYAAQKAAGRIHNDKNPPAGALVFYSGMTYGHVALATGDGQVITTWGYAGQRYAIRQVGMLDFSGAYLGWSEAPLDW